MRHSHITTVRLSAAAVALAIVGLWAAPAAAAPVADIRVTLTGTTVPVGAGSTALLSIFNAGPSDAVDVTVTVDFGGLHTARVEFDTALCVGPITNLCTFGIGTVAAGAESDYFLPLFNVDGEAGPAGSLAAFATHSGTDPDESNNVATADVTVVGDPGPDLAVVAPDVYLWSIDDGIGQGSTPIPPGRESAVFAIVSNVGTKTAKGLTVDVSVPEHVMLTGPGPTGTCQISADQREASCEYPAVEILPNRSGQQPATLAWPIRVAGDAPGPGTLTGGRVTVAAMAEADPPPQPLAAPAPEEIDLDATNNTDRFGVVVAGPPGGGGGGSDGDDPELPVTGMARGIAAAGAGLVILGGVLVLLARRRRFLAKV